MTVVRVEAGPRPYDVIVGPLADAVAPLAALGGEPILVTEPRVFGLHGSRVGRALGLGDPILVPEGEAAKQWDVLHQLLAALAEKNASRSTPIVALGGGAVGDLAGLAASLFKRGCPIVHVPTTLLAQADSAVGGKTAVDAFGEKNVIGTFHQPALVIADPAFLDTLDPRQLRAGYAEVVKYGLIDDPAFFGWCEEHGRALLAGDRALRTHAVLTSVDSKARIVAGDVEDRSGKRALLNLGHSFGHAIESAAGLGTVLHGEAVAAGMVLAFRFSAAIGLCPGEDAERVAAHLHAVGLPTSLGEVDLAGPQLLAWMDRDKKNEGSALRLVLARGVGAAFFEGAIDRSRLAAFLDSAD